MVGVWACTLFQSVQSLLNQSSGKGVSMVHTLLILLSLADIY